MTDCPQPATEEPKPVDWARIEQVYQTEEKLANIAKEYGLTVQKIVAHAQREGWRLRYDKQRAGKQKRSPGSTDPATLRKRLTALAVFARVVAGGVADPTEGAIRFHCHDETPSWAEDMDIRAVIGPYLFYASRS